MLLNILIGLIGLGIVVFVHEAGHLIVAKLVGIDVEAFSLGWGRKLFGFEYKGTEYRISAFPLGGYCKMRGDEALQQAYQNGERSIPKDEGSFFAARPLHRIFVAFAGPAVNLLFSVVVLAIVWWIGFSVQTFDNRIVLASEYNSGQGPDAAAEAGLETGDVIRSVGGTEIGSFRDLRQEVAAAAKRDLTVVVQRDSRTLEFTVTPELDPNTGAGQIGVYPWIEPVVDNVQPESPAAEAGIRPGDRVAEVNGREIPHSIALGEALAENEEEESMVLTRDGTRRTVTAPNVAGLGALGITFEPMTVSTPDLGPIGALARGASETWETLSVTVRGVGMLFRGVDVTQAVAGPIRITYFVGEVATQGMSTGLGGGLRAFFSFLSLLSVALFFMNLLPIPVLDGGQILLYAVEGLSRRELHPKLVYGYQMVGMVLVFMLLFFALFNDILFLSGR
ncbi:MAG: RIP metalloprotease RseP [Spirochaetes bacterium]|jgi:regulator of sigma E protease|nr:RIP metalloprotease RseP [Spirochaetota bacterium]